ncbi:response regulator [Lysinibacillus telephonicus]|uniref:Response regulator n=1 Tax=Lysinibacillus telephonicus TaxID=1714840 RepID=A0A431UVI5_9BACI|nr:response regulator [Lysinibacillus telephonicus]RTQ95069.1 response regulator [Lysinibacillus telephonicus]
MRAILIDDEQLPLMYLKKVLENKIDGVEVVGVYQDPIQAYENIKTDSPDVIFIDIHMPEMNGLEMAERIQGAFQNIEIVFVTGDDRHALEAFDLYAFDYIMKPLQIERLKKTVERLQRRLDNHQTNSKENKVENTLLYTFNQLKYQRAGCEPEIFKWRTTKVQELFAYMFHHRGKIVDRETLIEMLWPDFGIERGAKQLYTAIYHIRQTIKKAGIPSISISSVNNLYGGYIMHIEDILVDTNEWETKLNKLTPPKNDNIHEHEIVFSEYKGDYLGDYDYLWAEGERERLRRLWLNHGLILSRFYRDTENIQAAIKVNQRIQQMYPDKEESYFELMRLYASINSSTAVEEQYRLLRSVLKQEYDSLPSFNITNWYEKWKSKSYS